MHLIHRKTTLALLVGLTTMAHAGEGSFQRIASFPTADNIPANMDWSHVSSAEIITATKDGQTLIYSDSPLGGIGFVDIRNASQPKAAGFLDLNGEPTSVTSTDQNALVAVNTSASYTNPTGYLATVSLATQQLVQRCELGGQPDSIAVSPDQSLVSIAIENERDEDLNDGELPQMPAGWLVSYPLINGVPDCEKPIKTDLTGLAEVGSSDPEPEFVSINHLNEVVVTLQENNHLAIVEGQTGRLLRHFSAGSVDLSNVDTGEEGALTFDGQLSQVAREPDAVKWIDDERFVIANEGDYKGGSRGFTIFSKHGEILFESGLDLEYRIAQAGHYPEKRSGNKGVEPEGLEVAKFGDTTYIFVLSERSSMVGVYKDTGGVPEFVQLLPSGISPESAIAIPSRNLIATANEVDLIEDGGARAHVMLYQWQDRAPSYPQILSEMVQGRPLGWGALSGLTADDKQPGILYGVNDSFYRNQPTIYTIDANQTPAKIISATRVTRDGVAAQKLDLEGIATDGKGGFWLASEGRTDRLTPHAIYHVNKDGEIKQEIPFPAELMANEIRFGAEGITRVGDTLWIAIQRSWKDDAKNRVKLVSYNLNSKEWGAVQYPTESPEKGWVGLSEITAHNDWVYIVERDNQIGENAKIKRLYRVAMADMKPAKLGTQLPVVRKELVRDFIPDLQSLHGYVVDKIEGFTIDMSGKGYAVTDNDGVDDSSGETYFFSVDQL